MWLTAGGALVSARLCRLPEQEVHQPSKKCPQPSRRYINIVRLVHLGTSAPPEISSICVNPCNPWEDILSSRFCEFGVFCGRFFSVRLSVIHRSSPHYKHCVLFRAAHGALADRKQTGSRQGTGREQTGVGGEYRALLH